MAQSYESKNWRRRRDIILGWPLTVNANTDTFVVTGVTLANGTSVKVHSDSPVNDHLDVPEPLAVDTLYYVINATAP